MTLKHGDLKNTIEPLISIDEFQPKAGEEKDVIVVAFYFHDVSPAQDLNTFIQRGIIDTLDVEVSPNTDDEGRYLVFVEMARTNQFPEKFNALVKDIENLTEKVDWKVKPYLSDKEFDFGDPEIFKYVILHSDNYKTKEEFTLSATNENINAFFKPSLLTDLTVDNSIVTLIQNNNRIIAEVVDVGDYDTVIGRNNLAESAFNLNQVPYEAKLLTSMLGNCNILPIENFLLVSRDNEVMLLKGTYVSHAR